MLFVSYFAAAPSLVTMNKEKLMKMASAVRTGGKGSVRRYTSNPILFFFLLCFHPSPSTAVFLVYRV
jgi:hypothetical protein